jgi:hypothetical protein
MKQDEINILLSLENMSVHKEYFHYKKYGYNNNNKMNIYYYNHLSKIEYINNSLNIPTIYFFIDYFIKNNNKIKPTVYTSFSSKKFCLVVRKNPNEESKNLITKLEHIGLVDNISLYDDVILNKSCYHSNELINIFNKYKFILCFENSYSNGYITEKIFNCFYSEAIPLYKGPPNINDFIENKCFINFNDNNDIDKNINLINKLYNNKELYYDIIKSEKINKSFNDENYKQQIIDFIMSKK